MVMAMDMAMDMAMVMVKTRLNRLRRQRKTLAARAGVLRNPLSPARAVRFAFITGLAALLGALSGLQALSAVAEAKMPDAIPSFSPWLGRAQVYRAQQALIMPKAKPDMVAVEHLARQSLVAQSLNPRALWLMGLAADAKHDDAKATALMMRASSASRREIGPQLWLISRAALANDLGGALQHYDIAFRTSPEAQRVLFPGLTQALEAPEVARGFLPYLKSDTPWVGSFIDYAMNQSPHPELLAQLAIASGGFPKSDPPFQREQAVLARLIAKNDYEEAHRVFAALPGMNRAVPASTSFDKQNSAAQAGVFGWQIFSTPSIGAAITGAPAQADVFASSGERALVLRKLLFLSPGRYRFQARYGRTEMAGGASASWQLQCVHAGAEKMLWIRDDKAPLAASSALETDVSLAPGCEAYYLDLHVAGGPAQSGSQFSVVAVGLSSQ